MERNSRARPISSLLLRPADFFSDLPQNGSWTTLDDIAQTSISTEILFPNLPQFVHFVESLAIKSEYPTADILHCQGEGILQSDRLLADAV
jgi:hypothetical protein